MSEFLRNLAARSKGTLETVRPRVPSRFEPVQSDDGLLAARTPPREESVEDNPEAQRSGGGRGLGRDGATRSAADGADPANGFIAAAAGPGTCARGIRARAVADSACCSPNCPRGFSGDAANSR